METDLTFIMIAATFLGLCHLFGAAMISTGMDHCSCVDSKGQKLSVSIGPRSQSSPLRSIRQAKRQLPHSIA